MAEKQLTAGREKDNTLAACVQEQYNKAWQGMESHLWERSLLFFWQRYTDLAFYLKANTDSRAEVPILIPQVLITETWRIR